MVCLPEPVILTLMVIVPSPLSVVSVFISASFGSAGVVLLLAYIAAAPRNLFTGSTQISLLVAVFVAHQ